MGIIGKFFENIKNDNERCNAICDKVDEYITYIYKSCNNYDDYLDNSFIEQTKKEGRALIEQINNAPKIIGRPHKKLSEKKRILDKYLLNELENRVYEHNDFVAKKRFNKARGIVGKVEGRGLDDQQMQCIIKPMHNHLVIAGAGTGKTTTIIGKVKYLIKTSECLPEDILVVSFTNASAEEMRNRLEAETKEKIEASTFHKLGLNILTKVEGVKPKITSINLNAFVRDRLNFYIRDSLYLRLLCNYFLYSHKDEKAEDSFKTEEEYKEYIRNNPPITLKGEKVKSYGEMDIANFLYCNGIEYEYEQEYEIDTRTAVNAQYRPDFHLTVSGIYIEYFGIDKNGHVPGYFSSKKGKKPSDEYQEGMNWKRKVHEKNGTTLVECFAYERVNGELVDNLERNLKANGVLFQMLSQEEIWKKIKERYKLHNLLAGFAELISTVIALIKSNNYTFDTVRKLYRQKVEGMDGRLLLDIIEPIFNDYQNELNERGEIDFDDMINQATQLVREGKYSNTYKYVIVDEYQDISKSRFNLLKALRESMDFKLFCVGDDWQSIYRFAGSDLNYIIDFAKYWGQTEISKIETTYRFNDSLIDISGNFIMHNKSQIRKKLKCVQHAKNKFALGEIQGFTEEYAMRFMLPRILELPENSKVFFIGRYNLDLDLLKKYCDMQCSYDNITGITNITWFKRKDLDMKFLTAHKSKGLQADYVFIINNKDKGLGFPSKIEDDPILDVLLEDKEAYPYAEERRVFYVALTRARIKAFLVVIENNKSAFVSEIESRYSDELKKEAFTCPRCGGTLVKRTGKYGQFLGCTNYSKTGCKFTRKLGVSH